ncbi:MAG: diacylglycerol/lipid kinase family protein [Solirubrobacteraceae bacterium]
MKVAVVAHAGKTFDGGLAELRRTLRAEGVREPLWREVSRSKDARQAVRSVLKDGAELILVWGGDGMVQRCVDALGEGKAALAVVPAGTSNLFATNLGIEKDIRAAVRTALEGDRRRLDVGSLNGERFAVMAGVGFDAAILKGADAARKQRLGRAAYLLSAITNLGFKPFGATIKIDGERWYKGPASCILVANTGNLFGGMAVFDEARPDDGLLDVGVLTADGALQIARTLARTAVGTTGSSPFVRATQARAVKIALDRKVACELDGGTRGTARSLKFAIEPRAVTFCVPAT